LHQAARQLLRVRVGQPVEDTEHLALDRELPAAIEVTGLLAHHNERHRSLAGAAKEAQGLAQDVRVERTAEALVRGDDDEAPAPRLSPGEKRIGLVPGVPAATRG